MTAEFDSPDPLQFGPAKRRGRYGAVRHSAGGPSFLSEALASTGESKRVKEQAAEATIAGIAQKAGLSGGGVAVYGGLTANEIAAIGGLLVAVIGLAVQWYYKRKADKRDAELHAERMRELREP